MSGSHANDASHESNDANGHGSPPLPEPPSPAWLPALGAALFIGAGVWWLVCGAGGATPTTPAGSAAAAVAH